MWGPGAGLVRGVAPAERAVKEKRDWSLAI